MIGDGALLVTASGILVAAHPRRRARTRRKIEPPGMCEMLMEPGRNVFMQFDRWIVSVECHPPVGEKRIGSVCRLSWSWRTCRIGLIQAAGWALVSAFVM